ASHLAGPLAVAPPALGPARVGHHAAPQYDVSKDGQRVCEQARHYFNQEVVRNFWDPWGLQRCTDASWSKADDRTIRVALKFKHGWYTDKDGQVLINFVTTDSNWVGGGKIYNVVSSASIGVFGLGKFEDLMQRRV